jgi:hypothetical protein
LVLKHVISEIFKIVLAGVERSPLLLEPFIGLLYQPWMIDDDDCGAIGGMNDWKEN